MEKENNEPQRLGYRRKAAAEYLRETYGVSCSEGWLAKLAVSGNGPPFRRYARYPLYDRADLDAWVQSRMSEKVHSTAGLPPRANRGGRPRRAA